MDNKDKAETLNAALAEYDSTAAARDAAWENVNTNEDVAHAEIADRAALEKVQDAYWQVTKEYNSRKNCGFITIQDARKLAAHFSE